jgi:hypothetical protein
MTPTARFPGSARRRVLGLIAAVALGMTASVLVGGSLPASADTMPGSTGASCPTYNPPSTMTLVAGTPQTTRLGTPFADPFQVEVTNSNGCPITTPLAGIAVTFTAPSSGPSGTFSASGSNATLVGTSASGAATASLFTANTLPGGYLVTASSAYGSVTFSVVNTASGIAATITPLTPKSQAATAGTRFPQPLEVEVVDAAGMPVQGATVTFTLGSAGAGAGSGSGASNTGTAGASFDGGSAQAIATTNASGLASSPRFTANTVSGRFTATAATAGITEPAGFALDNLAARAPTIKPVGSAARSATAGSHYRRRLQVRVTGPGGAPVQGATVTFTLGAAGGGGSGGTNAAAGAGATFAGGATQATATTDTAGIATSPRFDANTTAGKFTATATLAGSVGTTSFSLSNRAGRPKTVAAGVAATESTAAGSRFPIRLAVTVTDKNNNPVAGAIVTFAAPAHGPSGTFARAHDRTRTIKVRANAAGVAVAPTFTANLKQGGYIVKATAKGAAPAAFALVNRPATQ